MPKFMCLQVSDPSTAGPEKPSPEQMQAMYAKFNAWRETFEDHIVDPGGPLKRQGKLLTANGDIDGPANAAAKAKPICILSFVLGLISLIWFFSTGEFSRMLQEMQEAMPN